MLEEKIRLFMRSRGMYGCGESVLVGVSGGKDSAALASIMKYVSEKDGVRTTLFHIDLGIHGFSERSRRAVEDLSEYLDLPLVIVKLEDEFGCTLDEMSERTGKKYCSLCGLVKRYFLTKAGVDGQYNAIATAHTLDDICVFLLYNLLTGNTFALKPVNVMDGFPRKVKPLFFVSERAVEKYVKDMGLPVYYGVCPHSSDATTRKIREVLDIMEEKIPNVKKRLVKALLNLFPQGEREKVRVCTECGMPAIGKVCAMCKLRKKLDG